MDKDEVEINHMKYLLKLDEKYSAKFQKEFSTPVLFRIAAFFSHTGIRGFGAAYYFSMDIFERRTTKVWLFGAQHCFYGVFIFF